MNEGKKLDQEDFTLERAERDSWEGDREKTEESLSRGLDEERDESWINDFRLKYAMRPAKGSRRMRMAKELAYDLNKRRPWISEHTSERPPVYRVAWFFTPMFWSNLLLGLFVVLAVAAYAVASGLLLEEMLVRKVVAPVLLVLALLAFAFSVVVERKLTRSAYWITPSRRGMKRASAELARFRAIRQTYYDQERELGETIRKFEKLATIIERDLRGEVAFTKKINDFRMEVKLSLSYVVAPARSENFDIDMEYMINDPSDYEDLVFDLQHWLMSKAARKKTIRRFERNYCR